MRTLAFTLREIESHYRGLSRGMIWSDLYSLNDIFGYYVDNIEVRSGRKRPVRKPLQ